MSKSGYFSGQVRDIIWENPSNNFYVMRMMLDKEGRPSFEVDKPKDAKERVTGLEQFEALMEESGAAAEVRGTVSGIDVHIGTWFGFKGQWKDHPKYGRQIHILQAPIIEGEWTAEVVASMVSGGQVSPTVAKMLYEHFGEELPQKIDDVEALQDVPGVTPMFAMTIQERWRSVKATYKSLDFLQDLSLPKHTIRRIWTTFGDEADRVLTENPWELVRVPGISFKQADAVADRLGIEKGGVNRARGALLYATKGAKSNGHVYVPTKYIKGMMSEHVSGCSAEDIVGAIKSCHKDGILIVDSKTNPNSRALYEPWFYRIENRSAALLAERMSTARFEGKDADFHSGRLAEVGDTASDALANGKDMREVALAAIRDWGKTSNLSLGPEQEQGVLNALVEPVSIITGLPGTGKTTSVKGLVQILQDIGAMFVMVSPTGIAAKRLTAVTGAEAQTIHRAFGARGIQDRKQKSSYVGVIKSKASDLTDGSETAWEYGRGRPYPAEVCIIDESSMVDQHLLYRILSCTDTRCRIVFIGDAQQLPSVGAGNVLRDLIASKRIPMVSLTRIYRQDSASDIVVSAHKIVAGEVPSSPFQDSKDFMFKRIPKEAAIQTALVEIVAKLYERRTNFQVLSPRHVGDHVGVTVLNQVIRERINPKSPGVPEARIGSWMMREGDRIMVVKNNYDLNVFNGDTGKVQRINVGDNKVLVKIHGPPAQQVELSFKEVGMFLRLAYCVTVHKMQGLEADVIVIPWVKSFRRQLQRNLLYTAVTRAREKVIMLGHKEAFVTAVHNNREDSRNTLLVERLINMMDNPEAREEIISGIVPVEDDEDDLFA